MGTREYGKWLQAAMIAMAMAGIMAATTALGQQTFMVDSLADDSLQVEGDNRCVTDDNECTFRAALEAANNLVGETATIEFSPAIETDSAGRSIVEPTSALPVISNQVFIRGESHPEYSDSDQLPRFLIDGDNAGSASGLILAAGAEGSEVSYIATYNFSQVGIALSGVDNVVLEGNHVGLRPAFLGTAEAAGNATFGIWITVANNNTLENNWVSANGLHGIMISDASANNGLIGNRVGLRPTAGGSGVAVAGNGDSGIQINSNAGGGNRIGFCRTISTTPFIQECRGNVAAANDGTGIRLGADGQQLTGNWVGAAPEDPTNSDFGNAGHGILIESDDNTTVVGLQGQGGNLVGHNGTAGAASGIRLASGAGNNVISDCIIGTNANDEDLGNSGAGVSIAETAGPGNEITRCRIENNSTGISLQAPNNSVIDNQIVGNGLIGVEALSAPLTIDDNTIGVHELAGIFSQHTVAGQFVTIRENHLGVRPDGTSIGNARGIIVVNGPARIGASGERGNVIGFNAFAGVEVNGASNTTIQSNYIGLTPDLDEVGNNGPGILISSGLEDVTSLSALIGYQPGDEVPFNPIPDGSGSGGLGNIITNNTVGIIINSDADNVTLERHRIRGNSIFGNTSGGIQLGEEIGFVDPGGSASGPNTLLNHPQLDDGATWLETDGGGSNTLHFRYRVPTSAANARYPLRIDFYAVESGETQGRSWVGSDEYPESSAGQWRSGTLTPRPGILTTAFDGSNIVAKAIDVDGNTSEFSAESANVITQDDPQPDVLLITVVGDQPNMDASLAACDTGLPAPDPAVTHCTLRAALQAAANLSGTVYIDFWEEIAVNAEGRSIFTPQTPLPPITGSTWIRGNTHPSELVGGVNFGQFNSVVIDGSSVDSGAGLVIQNNQNPFGSSVRISMLAIHSFPGYGIEINNSSRIFVEFSSIGLAPGGSGEVPAGNGAGGILVNNSNIIPIENNWISANGGHGIVAVNNSNDVRIWRNEIGSYRNPLGSGTLAEGNSFWGIAVFDGDDTLVWENHVEDNLGGILMENGSSSIRENLVIENNGIGITIIEHGTSIEDNVVVGNTLGIQLNRSSDGLVQSNHIGMLPDGTPAGNSNGGMFITSTQDDGESSGNTIGFQATAPIPFGYNPEDGDPGNVIAHNGGAGVRVFSDRDNTTLINNTIRGNRFFGNAGQAIDLGPEGDSVDPGGAAAGPNNLQNFPVFNTELTLYDTDQDQLTYAFSVDSESTNAAYPIRVDLYLADGPSAQGRFFIDTVVYESADATSELGGSLVPPAGLNLEGAWLVATATDSDGNTSQFSAAVLLSELTDEIFQDRFEDQGGQ